MMAPLFLHSSQELCFRVQYKLCDIDFVFLANFSINSEVDMGVKDIDKLRMLVDFIGDLGRVCLEPLQDDGKVTVTDFMDRKFYEKLFELFNEGKELLPHMDEIRGEISEVDSVEMISLVSDFVDMAHDLMELMDQAKKLKDG